MKKLVDIIKRHWGYERLWPLQDDVMNGVMDGRDSLVVLPTGGGKSLCFQAPAVAMDGTAIIVSPLISLMKDQVDSLNLCGVTAACINSSQSYDELRQADETLRAGHLKLLYVAPERVVTSNFIDYMKQAKLSFIAVDEAHCISHWGHDFRPEYRELCKLRRAFPDVAVHAFTATATPHVRDDICKELNLNDPGVFVGSFDRPNLTYRAFNRTSKFDQVRAVIERHRGESGIVYCITRKDVDALCGDLCAAGYAALPYHAGMTDEVRKTNQEAFTSEKTDIIVATVAFGMGIDKSNVRYVVHAGMPKSIEHYQQESGRAGRDGLDAECCLFYSGGDFAKWRYLLGNLEGEASKIAISKLNDMVAYCTGVTCRHESLVSYFGQTLEKDRCDACDICLDEADLVDDALTIGQKIMSCVVRLGRFAGPSYTALVLKGSRDARVLDKGHDRLSTWGILDDHSRRQIRDWTEQLAAQGYLAKTGEYNVLDVTSKGRKVLRGDETPRLLKPAVKTRKKKRSTAEVRSWHGVDRDLFELLRAKRLEIATEREVPAFVIFSDVSLRDMARHRPVTPAAFLKIHGVGEKKSQSFADIFLPVISSYLDANGMDGDATQVEYTAPKRKRSNRQDAKQKAYGLFEKGYDVADVAVKIGRALSTTHGYLEDYLVKTGVTDPDPWINENVFERIEKAVATVGDSRLRTIHDFLDGQVDYDKIRIAVVCLRNRNVIDE